MSGDPLRAAAASADRRIYGPPQHVRETGDERAFYRGDLPPPTSGDLFLEATHRVSGTAERERERGPDEPRGSERNGD